MRFLECLASNRVIANTMKSFAAEGAERKTKIFSVPAAKKVF